MIVFQSSAAALRLCPSGTFENSPAIHGWVHRPKLAKVPKGRQKSSFTLPIQKTAAWDTASAGSSFCLKSLCLGISVAKNTILRNEPNFRCKLLSINKKRGKQCHHSNLSPDGAQQPFLQRHSQDFSCPRNSSQLYARAFWKKRLFIFHLVALPPWWLKPNRLNR